MLMSKNVNNDVSKDSPIQLPEVNFPQNETLRIYAGASRCSVKSDSFIGFINLVSRVFHLLTLKGAREARDQPKPGSFFPRSLRGEEMKDPGNEVYFASLALSNGHLGRDPFNQNFRKFRSKTQWIGSVQPEKFRKSGSTF